MSDYYADVDILVNGKPIKKFAHQGKLFIQSNHDVEYSIRIRNKGWSRRLFVITVDGINVIDGQAGGSSTMGYIIAGNTSMEVKGFRSDNNTENAFKFSCKHRSYAAKSDVTGGDTSNCGVIGIEVYDEKVAPPIWTTININPPISNPQPQWWNTNIWSNAVSGCLPTTTWSSSSPSYSCKVENSMGNLLRSAAQEDTRVESACLFSCSADMAAEEPKRGFDMGTEYSKHQVHSPVVEVAFEIGTKLTTLSIYYASRDSLIEMGVPVVKENQIPSLPNPFPSRFCKPPRW